MHRAAGLVVLVAALGIAVPAQATFPGGNGRIAYTWSRGGEGFEAGLSPRLVGVVSVRPDGGDRRLVARRGREPAYSPDGRRIAFRRFHRLWVARANGSDARPVTPKDWLVGQYEWSPRGTRLAFERGFMDSVRSALYGVEPDGSGLRRLLKAPMPVSLSSGAWSPNGKAIVYGQSTAGGSLVRVVREGRITTLVRPGHLPTWSRGGLIAYETPVAGETTNQVCVKRPEPGALARCIAIADASVSDPTWSPDGRRLMVMYTPQGQGPAEVWTVRPDGTVLTRAPRPGSAFPIFSPNGRRLAYSLARFAGDPRLEYMDLFVQRPDGTGMRRVARGGQAQAADWQPLP
jgi:Tol biopolymer transport system component